MATITAQRVENLTLNVTAEELGRAVLQVAWARCGSPDDAGCDWYTYGSRVLIAGDPHWQVADDETIAVLVDASNILRFGKAFRVEDED